MFNSKAHITLMITSFSRHPNLIWFQWLTIVKIWLPFAQK